MNRKLGYFVTGTDTEIGKTLVTTALLHALVKTGLRAAAMKPVAAGAELRDGVWCNDDSVQLAAASNVALPAAIATPYLLKAPAAPHIVAAHEGVTIDLTHIRSCFDRVSEMADAVVVEGVGGFRVPLSRRYDVSDVARQLGLPVIMVVGLRLGCLSHALLTADVIAARGLILCGWVANMADPAMLYPEDNIAALTERIAAPLLGCVPRLSVPLPAAAASHLDFSLLPGWPVASHPA